MQHVEEEVFLQDAAAASRLILKADRLHQREEEGMPGGEEGVVETLGEGEGEVESSLLPLEEEEAASRN